MDLRDIKEFFRDFIGYIITFAIIIVIFTFIVAFHPIAGNSMVPTLEEGNIVVVNKFYKHLFDLKRNQIVIVKKDSKTYIKRGIGLPGENIYFKNNTLYINDKGFKEEFLANDVTTYDYKLTDYCGEELCKDGKIPKDYYFVLGDNRNDSKDSRSVSFGLVHKDEIEGLVIFKMWPIKDVGRV
jgi:signal peptidase I